MSEAHPFVPTLLILARVSPGQRVLDVATGTGIAAEAALDAVGPSGHVTAVDDTPLMLDRVREMLEAMLQRACPVRSAVRR
jgi:ubiquinone/menaquinone biosynthesis C-methylase UbiE